ncbi:MAG: PAS domain S-box protein [Pyrinomonadaceae bacterium]|nr:PAS domain S-box protein [Pyrinomonadaceae bacterium]
MTESHSAALPIASIGPEFGLELYREIFRHSNEPIAIISPEGRYLEQNAAHRDLLGYSDQELLGQTPAIHMGREVFENIVNELAQEGVFRGEVTSHTKTGEVKHIELSAFTTRDGAGDPICYVGIKRNVTERKQAEEALRRSEAELTDFFENAAIGLHWVSADGTVLRVNQAELDLLGYSREEYVGRNIADFHVDPDAMEDILSRLQAGELLSDYDARLRCKDGSIKHVRINSSVFREQGRFVHTRSFTRDITEGRVTGRRLALQYAVTRILSDSTDFIESTRRILQVTCTGLEWDAGGLWTIDDNAQVLRCVDFYATSPTAVSEFEKCSRGISFKKGEGLPGRIWQKGAPARIDYIPEDPNFPRAAVARQEGFNSAFGFPILLGDEVLGVLDFFSKEIREPDDELVQLAASIGGQIGQFTKRKRAEDERAELLERERDARADAEKANRLKDEFLATLSHELRTPLNAVIGWSRMLRSGRLDKESAAHAVEVIERNAWSQKQIIEDILDVSRVITGKLHLNLGPVDLVAVVDAALDAVRPALEAKAIKIETIIDAGLRIVQGDADRLQQVVWNLLSNAAKFTPSGGRVGVRLSHNNAHVQIQVSDSGPGIDPAFLPHVFERFRQADGTTTRTYGGLGLGLAIVRHLVELHGGIITAQNRADGPGAIFTVRLRLPTGELRPEALSGALVDVKDSESETPSLDNLRILVVDDERDTLDLVTMDLTQHGASVTGVTGAAEALSALQHSHFDLLISDIAMPETDGYELIRQVRKRESGQEKRLPAVALTAYARVQDRMRAIMAGYNTNVVKPVEANELVTVVASLVGRLGKI